VPSRTARRYRHKRLARIVALAAERRASEAARTLVGLQAEARRRARSLGAAAVWDLARSSEIDEVINRLDPTGGLQSDLDQVCAEAIAEVAGRHLVRGSRPLADRSRCEQA
jgi:hypothetical protein